MANIKVDRVKLLKVLKTEQAALLKEHKASMKQYGRDKATYHPRLKAALKKALAVVERGQLPHDKWGNINVELPREPIEPASRSQGRICTLDNLIQALSISTQPTITIGDRSPYMPTVCKYKLKK